jgi:hypothetical protein
MTPKHQKVVDDALQAIASYTQLLGNALALPIGEQPSTIEELRQSPLGQALTALAHVAEGHPGNTEDVEEKLRIVYNFFFAAPLHQALRIPSDFHTSPLGSLLNDARAQVTSLKSAVNIADAARTAGVTRQTIYDWIDQGKLSPIYVNGKPMLPLSQLEQLKHDRS